MTDLRKLQVKATQLASALADRQKNDPLFNFTPFQKQQDFIDDILYAKTLESWYFGANRSGKSDAASYIGAHLARFGRPGEYWIDGRDDRSTSGWVVSLDFPTSRDIIQPKYFDNKVGKASHAPFIPDREIRDWRQSDQLLILHNDSVIGFKSADSGRSKFQGVGKDWIHFDEEPPVDVYEECSFRADVYPLMMFASCTLLPPEGQVGGVTWAYEEIAKPYKQNTLEGKTVHCASMYDNPHLTKDITARYEAKYKRDSIEFRIRVLGELLPGLSGARCYTGFDNAYHVKPQLEYYKQYDPLCWTIDFNVSPYISLVGQRDMGKFRVFRELMLEEGDHDMMCELFYEEFGGHKGPIWMYGDQTGDHKNMYANSYYTSIMNNMRQHNINVHLKLPSVNPPVPDRIAAMNVAFKSEAGLHNIEIDPSCVELIADCEQVLRDPRGGIKKSNNNRDPYYRRTHSSDAFGYWVVYESPVKPVRTSYHSHSRATVVRAPGYVFSRKQRTM